MEYNSMQSILDASLGEWAEQGFRLQEIADDELVLWHGNSHVATFYQTRATISLIQDACQGYKCNNNSPTI